MCLAVLERRKEGNREDINQNTAHAHLNVSQNRNKRKRK